jgi:predicted ester cyclase
MSSTPERYPDDNETLIRRYFEADELGFPDRDAIFAPGFVSHRSSSDDTLELEQFLAWAKNFNDALPYRCTIDDVLVDGDRVAVRVTWRGTHTRKFGTLDPTGKSFRVSGIGIFRIADGRVAERWLEFDEAGLMRQLGAA